MKDETKKKLKENVIIVCFGLGAASIISYVGLVVSGFIHHGQTLAWVDKK